MQRFESFYSRSVQLGYTFPERREGKELVLLNSNRICQERADEQSKLPNFSPFENLSKYMKVKKGGGGKSNAVSVTPNSIIQSRISAGK